MTDDLATPEYLEALASAVRSLDARLSTFERQSLEDLLTHGGGARMGGAGLPSPHVGTNQAASSIGNVLPYVGRKNLLLDPLFDAAPDDLVTITTAPQQVSPGWRVYYELVSGVAPIAGPLLYRATDRANTATAFTSGSLEVYAEWAASGAASEILIYVESTSQYPTIDYPTLPFVVASGLVTRYTGGVATQSETWLELVTDDGGTVAVVAQSEVFRYTDFGGSDNKTPAMVAALLYNDATHNQRLRYRWVCRVVRAADTIGNFFADLGDPMLAFAYTPDPPVQNPVLAAWVPTDLVNPYVVDDPYDLIRARRAGDTADRFRSRVTDADGVSLEWGPGNAAIDTFLYRDGVGVLRTDGALSFPGFLRAGGTSFPTSPTTNDRFYRTDLAMEFYWNGTRWLSTTIFEVRFGSGAASTSYSADATNLAWSPISLHGGSDAWLLDCIAFFFVNTGGTALGASHSWQLDFQKADNDSADFSSVGSPIIASGANGARRITLTINSLLDPVNTGFRVNLTRVGTPGAVFVSGLIRYRVVAT